MQHGIYTGAHIQQSRCLPGLNAYLSNARPIAVPMTPLAQLSVWRFGPCTYASSILVFVYISIILVSWLGSRNHCAAFASLANSCTSLTFKNVTRSAASWCCAQHWLQPACCLKPSNVYHCALPSNESS